MSSVGLIGILLCLLAMPLFKPARTASGFLLFFALLAFHVATAVAFYEFSLTTSADAALYYFDSYGLRRGEFQMGTIFVIKLVQGVKGLVGGTYLDHFLIFQTLGFWGILLLQRVFEQVRQDLDVAHSRLAFWLLFLPGMHFWTSAIGKDAPLFFGICLALWASLRLSRRIAAFAAAIVCMMLVRPHIALIVMASLAAAAVFGRKTNGLAKVALVIVGFAGVALLAGTVETNIGVSLTDPGSISDFLERQQEKTSWVKGAVDEGQSIFPVRLFSLLFRPLFFDAHGAMGLLASFENLIFIFIIASIARHWRLGVKLFKASFTLRFGLITSALIAFLLALTFYNVGLGLRQKMMIVPGVFAFFIAQWSVRLGDRRARLRKMRDPGLSSTLATGNARLAGGPS